MKKELFFSFMVLSFQVFHQKKNNIINSTDQDET